MRSVILFTIILSSCTSPKVVPLSKRIENHKRKSEIKKELKIVGAVLIFGFLGGRAIGETYKK